MVITTEDIAKSPYLQRRMARRASRFRSSNNQSYQDYATQREQNAQVLQEQEQLKQQLASEGITTGGQFLAKYNIYGSTDGGVAIRDRNMLYSGSGGIVGYNAADRTVPISAVRNDTSPYKPEVKLANTTFIYKNNQQVENGTENSIQRPINTNKSSNSYSIFSSNSSANRYGFGYGTLNENGNKISESVKTIEDSSSNSLYSGNSIFDKRSIIHVQVGYESDKNSVAGISRGVAQETKFLITNIAKSTAQSGLFLITEAGSKLSKFSPYVNPNVDKSAKFIQKKTGATQNIFLDSTINILPPIALYNIGKSISSESTSGIVITDYRSIGSKIGEGIIYGAMASELGVSGYKATFKNPTFDSVEVFKSKTSTTDFGGNILSLDSRGNTIITSGEQVTTGSGLFKLEYHGVQGLFKSPKVFEASFKETGNFLNMPSGKVLGQSEGLITIKKFDNKVRTGKYNVKLNSESVMVPNGVGADITSVSLFKFKNGGFKRTMQGKSLTEGDLTYFKGASKDYDITNGGRPIPGTDRIIGGRSLRLLEVTNDGITNTLYSNINAGKTANAFSVKFSKDMAANAKGFSTKEFVASSDQLLGIKSTSKPIVPSMITEQSIKSHIQDNILKMKTPSNTNVYHTIVLPQVMPLASKNVAVGKSTSMIKYDVEKVVPKISSNTNLKNTVKPLYYTRINIRSTTKPVVSTKNRMSTRPTHSMQPKNIISTKTEPILNSKVSTQLRQVIKPRQVQSMRQTTLLRQAHTSRGFNTLITLPPTNPILPKINLKSLNHGMRYNSRKNNGVSIKARYTPSIEANIFNIHSRKINKALVNSGLVLRPIRSR